METSTFRSITNTMADVYEAKSADYGNTAGELYEKYCEQYYIIMADQKLSRIKNISRNGKANNESLYDSWLDLANYCVLRMMEEYEQ